MFKNFHILLIAILFCFLFTASCLAQTYNDGIYEAGNSQMDVEVKIQDGKIAEIKILEHKGGPEKYGEMLAPLIEQIIEGQTTEVDGISGATYSSQFLKEAVQEALKKATVK